MIINQGPLPSDGQTVDPATFLEAWIAGTEIYDLGAAQFSGGTLQFVYSQTEPPAAADRFNGMMWFARGEGRLYMWDQPDLPSALTFSDQNWIALSDRKEIWCWATHEIPKGAPVSFVSTTNSEAVDLITNDTQVFGDMPFARPLWRVSTQSNGSGVTNTISDIIWVAMETANSGSLFRACDIGICDVLMPTTVTDSYTRYQKVTDTVSGNAGAVFGKEVGVDGNYALIGAAKANTADSEAGAAFIYERTGVGWALEATLTASDAAQDDRFGQGLSISGQRVAVGAPKRNSSTGAVYIFDRTDRDKVWSETDILTASDAATGDKFGEESCVCLAGDVLVVGAPVNDAAYVFEYSGGSWSQVAKLEGDDVTAGDYFGWGVHTDGTTIVVGAWLQNTFTGAVYVFTKVGGTWTQQAKLTASDAATIDQFGAFCRVQGNTIAVSAIGKEAVYIFTGSGATWSQSQKIADGTAGNKFGAGLGLDQDRLVIGEWRDDDSGSNAGAAHVYRLENGTYYAIDKLLPPASSDDDYMGYGLAISNRGRVHIVCGAYEDDDEAADAGAAYFFETVRDGSAGAASVDERLPGYVTRIEETCGSQCPHIMVFHTLTSNPTGYTTGAEWLQPAYVRITAMTAGASQV